MYVDEQTMAGLMVMMGGMATALSVLSIIFVIMLIIAHWKMFTKAGEPGWKSIIPIYSSYVLFKLVWTAKDFAILCGSIVLGYVFALVGGNAVVQSGELVATDGGNPILGILAFAALIVALVWAVRLALKTAAAYGKGTGFGIGLVLFPTIFTLILGFGSAEYVGPQE
jgi:hypothetical protein